MTVEPLVNSLKPYGVPFNPAIDHDDVDKVADAVQDYIKGKGDYRGQGDVLICWQHDTLQRIAQAIGVDDAPAYPGTRFDLIWTIKAPYDKLDCTTSEHVPTVDDQFANEPMTSDKDG